MKNHFKQLEQQGLEIQRLQAELNGGIQKLNEQFIRILNNNYIAWGYQKGDLVKVCNVQYKPHCGKFIGGIVNKNDQTKMLWIPLIAGMFNTNDPEPQPPENEDVHEYFN